MSAHVNATLLHFQNKIAVLQSRDVVEMLVSKKKKFSVHLEVCPIAKGKRKILWQFECKEQWIPETDNRFMFSVLAVMGFAVNCHFVSLLPWHIAENPLKLSQLLYRESKNSLFFEERVSLWKTISQWLFQKISRWSYGWSEKVWPLLYCYNRNICTHAAVLWFSRSWSQSVLSGAS